MKAPRKKVTSTAGITMRSDCAMHAAIEGRLHVHQSISDLEKLLFLSHEDVKMHREWSD